MAKTRGKAKAKAKPAPKKKATAKKKAKPAPKKKAKPAAPKKKVKAKPAPKKKPAPPKPKAPKLVPIPPEPPEDPGTPGGRVYMLQAEPRPLDRLGRDTVGGRPVLAAQQPWPTCHCGQKMTFFFQLDIPRDLAPFGGSHLLAFQCPKHNDAVFPPRVARMPAGYWDTPGQFWRIYLNKPGAETTAAEVEPALAPAAIVARPSEDLVKHGTGVMGWKLGGVPSWAQDPESYECSCGGQLRYLCQVPINFGFATNPGQPEQPGWYRSVEYALMLGNEIYILACDRQCDPRAVWPVNQN
jgi:hypothetical protein